MLKIAQCTDSFLPVHDGVSRVANAYARGLAARGHEVYVITPMETEEYRGSYPFEILDYLAISIPGASQMKTGIAVMDLHYFTRVNAHSFDIVHAHSPGSAGMEAVRLAEKCHAPLVGTFHTKYLREYLSEHGDEHRAQLNKFFAFDFFSRCDEIWTVSEEARTFLLDRGFPGNVEVFDNGTEREAADAETRARARELFHLSNAPALLFAGSLEREKNLPRVLEAAALLKSRGLSFQLLLAGRGPDEHHARAVSQELGLAGTVRFLGQVTDEALLAGLYAESALCLFPMQNISAGLVVREAAVQGTPSLVVAGSVASGLIQNGFNGLTCGDTAESMADAIEEFLLNPERMENMRAQAKAIAPVSWDAVLEHVSARYEALAGMERAALRRKRGLFRAEMDKIDLTLEKRAMDLIWKFLTQDTQHLFAYAHRPQKPPCLPKPEAHPLPRSSPEEQGVSSRAMNALLDTIHADAAARAHEIMIVKNGAVIAEAAWAPYETGLPHQLYSLSKSITSTAIGMLVDEGLLDIDEALCDIFYDKAPERRELPAYSMTVRHLLNMSTGSLYNESGSAMGADWEKDFLRAGTKFEPGTAFDYNSMNTYMLAAIVRRKTGESLTNYLRPRLYEPLGIAEYYWETCPNGTEKGGWGLSLTMESVAKIGQLYLNKGVWHTAQGDRRLLSAEWIEEATHPQIGTPKGEITYGYGHQIWMTAREGSFLFNGAFGQYMLALPDLGVLVVLLSGSSRLFAQGGVLDYVTAALDGAQSRPLIPDPRGAEALQTTISTLSVRYHEPYSHASAKHLPLAEFAQKLDGRVYTFSPNIGGIFPMILQAVHNNFTSGLTQAVFSAGGDGALHLELVEGEEKHRISFQEGCYTGASVSQRGDVFEVRAAAEAEVTDSGELALNAVVHFIETPFTRLVRITLLADESIRIVFDENPSIRDASEMMLELTGITRVEVVRNLMPLLKRDRMQHTLRTFTTITVQGKL
ncbi:MAG: serine hydrolase [Eubacteriales bacterium]|nr:serine hydrolase [Eubacteriales bacterium]